MKYLHAGKSKITFGAENIPEHRILMDETFARKCLLGSMKIMGDEGTLRPNWTNHFHINYSESESTLLGHLMIHIVDEVVGVDDEDLEEVLRTVKTAQGDHISAHGGRSTHTARFSPSWNLFQHIDTSVLAYVIEHGNSGIIFCAFDIFSTLLTDCMYEILHVYFHRFLVS